MPLYEYICPKCGHKFDRIIIFERSEEVTCPKCHTKAKKQISAYAHFEFKGALA